MNGEWIKKPKDITSVIFVHGILSNGENCWRHENGSYWPELLSTETELEGLGIYVYTYETGVFSGSYRLSDVVDDLKERMRVDDLFQSKKIVFVCHSMGGIVVRKFLVERSAYLIERKLKIGLFLVASPSLGSSYANWLSPLAQYFGHAQAKALRFTQDNAWLNDLDKEFLNIKESNKIEIEGKELIEDKFVMLKKWWRKQIVEPFSGARYFGERFKVPHSDHFSIAKPENKDAIQHRLLCQFIKSMLREGNKVSSSNLEGPLKIIELVAHQKEGSCLIDFMVKNEGSADVIILSAELEVVDVIEVGNKGGFDYSAKFNIDISDLKDVGDIAICRLERNIKPGEAERFGVELGANNLGLGTFRTWELLVSLNTDSGRIPVKVLEVSLPSKFAEGSITNFKIDEQRNTAPDELSILVNKLKENGEEFSSYAVNTIADQLVWGEEPKLQCEAAHALEIIGAPAKEVIPMITEALNDPDQNVRKMASRALNHIKSL